MDFVVPANYRVGIKESEKRDEDLRKLWNMSVTVISIVIGALGMVSKDLVKKTG